MKKVLLASMSLVLLTACTTTISDPGEKPPTKAQEQIVPSTTINIESSSVQHVAVSGEYAYIGVKTDKDSLVNEIQKIHLKTKKKETIFKYSYKVATINDLQANKDWLVWNDSTDSGFGNNVWARNLKTGETKKIYQQPESSTILIFLKLYDHYVAWSYQDGENVKIKLKDLNTDKEKDIAQYHTFAMSNETDVDTVNGRIIWTDSKNGTGIFQIYDIKSAKLTTITDGLKGLIPGHITPIGKDKLLFLKSKDNFVEWNDNKLPLRVYDLNKKTDIEIIKGTEMNYDIRVEISSNHSVVEAKLTSYARDINIRKFVPNN